MSASLNLASQPFRNRALPWTIAGVVAAASLALLLLMVSRSGETNRRALEVERESDGQRQQITQLEQRAEEIKKSLTADQQQSLKAALSLVERKRFSWARLFADLESVLPASVRVKRISVGEVSARGGRTVAQLELVVFSKNPADVTGMISEMSRSGLFNADLVEQSLGKERAEAGTESTLDVTYYPRASVPASASASGGSVASGGYSAQAVYPEMR